MAAANTGSGPPPSTSAAAVQQSTAAAASQRDSNGDVELTTADEVKQYCHEGDGEKNEYLNSMDLHDIKSELEKDAEEAEVSHAQPAVFVQWT